MTHPDQEPQIQRYRDRADACARSGDVQGQAHALRHWADILRREGQVDASLTLYREVLDLYRTAPDTAPMNLANALRGFALLQSHPVPGDSALAAWREARDIYAANGVDAGVEECEHWLSRAEQETGSS